jgi:hypothetical protein
VSQLPRVARTHDLRPNDSVYSFDEYESVVNRDLTIRQVYEWPNINNATIYNNVSNGLNGFQFSYDLPSDRVQVVVQASPSATLAMYDNAMWATYHLGEVFKIQDPGYRSARSAQSVVRQQESAGEPTAAGSGARRIWSRPSLEQRQRAPAHAAPRRQGKPKSVLAAFEDPLWANEHKQNGRES